MNAKRIGKIRKVTRYPVKSMAGVELKESMLGWHGLRGDRRFGVRQTGKPGDFPWLTASKLPELLLFQPIEFDLANSELPPTRIKNPEGVYYRVGDDAICHDIAERANCKVELMAFKNGIFDDATVSIIASSTVSHLCSESGVSVDSRRFRANVEILCDDPIPFADDQWVGSVVAFGVSKDAPAVFVMKRDVRCKMIGLDPDSAEYNPSVIQTALRLNDNDAGVYASVLRPGILKQGDSVFRMDLSEMPEPLS